MRLFLEGSQALFDKCIHLYRVSLYALVQFELCACSYQVVLRIGYFVVGISIEVVGEESHGLHVGEELCGIGNIFNLYGQQEGRCLFELSLYKGVEDRQVEVYFVQVRFVFAAGIGSRP